MVDLRKTAADILYKQLQDDEIACCRDEDPECHCIDYIDDHYDKFQESAVEAMMGFAVFVKGGDIVIRNHTDAPIDMTFKYSNEGELLMFVNGEEYIKKT